MPRASGTLGTRMNGPFYKARGGRARSPGFHAGQVRAMERRIAPLGPAIRPRL